MAGQGALQGLVADAPNFNRLIAAARGKEGAVGGEFDGPDIGAVAWERGQRGGIGQAPKLDCVFASAGWIEERAAPGGEQGAVRREIEAPDRADMAEEDSLQGA